MYKILHDKCCSCGLCYSLSKDYRKICFRYNSKKEVGYKNLLGSYREIVLAKGKFKSKESYSGALISILLALKEENLIDGVLGVSRGENILQPLPLYAKTTADLQKLAGMRHSVCPLLSIINKLPKNKRICLVGTSCHLASFDYVKRKGLLEDIKIKYKFSIACGINYDYYKF